MDCFTSISIASLANKPLPATMRAYVQERYGDAGSGVVRRVPVPVAGPGEVLAKICAAGICKADIHLMSGIPYAIRATGFGLTRPRHAVPGQNVSGVVVSVGDGVADFKPGDAVCGQVPSGGFAEYAAAAAACFVRKPEAATHAEASALGISGITALQALRDAAEVKPGQSVLITGAGGGVGTFAVQIAHALGARVTAVCSERHRELMKELNVEAMIDYDKEQFWTVTCDHDVFLDLVGTAELADCRSVLKRGGTYIAASALGGDVLGPLPRMAAVALNNLIAPLRMKPFLSLYRREDLAELRNMVQQGLIKPVIGGIHELEDIQVALRLVAQGHAEGTHVVQA